MQITDWQIRFDPDDVGRDQGWYGPASASACVNQYKPIRVPGAWNQLLGDDTPDVAWYRTTVYLDDEGACRWWLRFDAVCTDVQAWCNGVAIGRHSGNWVPFAFELPKTTGLAEVVLRVDRVRPAPAVTRGKRVIEQGHITKGFHDILSRQPAGLWQPVTLHRTGAVAIRPLGVGVIASLAKQRAVVEVDAQCAGAAFTAIVRVLDPDGQCVGQTQTTVTDPADCQSVRSEIEVPNPRPWSPKRPDLYTLEVQLLDGHGAVSDASQKRFGFRQIETNDRRVLLNGQAIHLSAVLDWGHEPMQTAPAPSDAELTRRLLSLKAMGFNCICVCLWYMPKRFYELCDEMGMLVWQEHPVWKPEMTPANREVFKQHYEAFFRRDRNHPSVVIVSGSCEHDAFDPEIAQWWWARAHELLPDRLLQVQTAFLRLVPPEQTDLYDEHTYENSGRWPEFLADMDQTLSTLPAKPYVMGESVLYNDWPDVPGLLAVVGSDRPWWVSEVLDDAQGIEMWIAQRYGPQTLERFRRDARAWHLGGRKWQTEAFRHEASHAGLVQNSIRDVAQCPLGLMDDLDQFRLTPEQTRPWLAGNMLLMKSNELLTAQSANEAMTLSFGASAFGDATLGTSMQITLRGDAADWELSQRAHVRADRGEVTWTEIQFQPPTVDRPTLLDISAQLDGAEPNRWRLWLMPQTPDAPTDVRVVPGSPDPPEMTFEERAYSSGWGLEVGTWQMAHPRPELLLPQARHWSAVDEPTGLCVCSTLSDEVLRWLANGGRVLHLPDGYAGSLRTKIPTLWGQSPLIPAAGPLDEHDTRWVMDTLDRDLHHRWVRTIPTGEMAIAERVDPFIRLLHTHNAIGKVEVCDDLFAAHVGEGLLVVSSLDHTSPAGRHLLHRLIDWLDTPELIVRGRLDIDQLAQLRLTPEAAAVTVTPA